MDKKLTSQTSKGETLVDHLVRKYGKISFLKIKPVKRTGGFVYIKHNFDNENK